MRNKAFIEANKKIADEAEKHSDVTEFLQRTGYTPDEGEVSRGVMQSLQTLQDFNTEFQASQEKERAQQKYENQLGQAAEVFGVGPNTPGASLMSLVPPEQMSSPADLLQQRYEQLQQDVQVKQQQGNITWGKGEEARQKSYEKAAEDFEAALAGTGEFAKREIPNRLKAARQLLNKMEQNRPKKRQPKYSEIVSSRVTPVPGVPGMVAVDDTGDGNVNVKPVAAKTPEVEAATAAAAQANAQTAAMKERNQFQLEMEKLKQTHTQMNLELEERKRDRRLKYDDLEIKKRDGEIKALLDAQKQQGSPAIQQGAQAILQQPAGQFERAAAEAQQALSAMEQQRAQTAATMQQAAQTYSAVPKAAEAFQILRDVSDSGLEPTQLLPEQQKAYAASQIYVDRLMQYNPIPVSADITEEQLKAFEPGTLVLTPDGAIRTIKHQD